MQPIKGSRIVLAAFSLTGAFAPLGCRTPSAEHGDGLPGSEPLRWAPSIRAGHLWPEPQGERLFTVTVGKEAPAPLTVRAASRPDGWREITGSWSAVDVIRTASGALQTKAEHDLRNRVTVAYDPPIPLLPARLGSGQPTSGEAEVHVINASNNSTRDRGICRYTVALAGLQRVETPAGAFDAYIVKTCRELHLNLARAEVTWWSAYVPGRGLVAHHQVEEVRAMNLFSTRRVFDLYLAR